MVNLRTCEKCGELRYIYQQNLCWECAPKVYTKILNLPTTGISSEEKCSKCGAEMVYWNNKICQTFPPCRDIICLEYEHFKVTHKI